MHLTLRDSLPFVTISVIHGGVSKEVSEVLVDTGSASTVLSADVGAVLGIVPEPGDRLRTLRGVGGRELVFTRRVGRLEIDGRGVDHIEIEIAGMDYGFSINGILGMDFLRGTNAIVDLGNLELDFHD